MLFTRSFVTQIILTFITIFLLVNIIFAFDIADTLPSVYIGGIQDGLDDYYFGVSTLIEAFDGYWGDLQEQGYLKSLQDGLTTIKNMMDKVSINSLAQFQVNVADPGDSWVLSLLSIFDLLFNIAYQFFAIIYGLMYIVYALSWVISFFTFFIALAGGYAKTPLTNTYPVILGILP